MSVLPPGPEISPFIQKLRWIFDPLTLMDECHQQYGDTFTLQLGKNARPMVVFSHPEAIHDIFKAPSTQFDTGRANQILKPLLGPRSLELLDGKRHLRHKKIMLPPFQGSRLQFYQDIIHTTAQAHIEEWAIGETLIARDHLQKLSFDTMSQILFDSADTDLQQEIYHCFDRLFQIASTNPIASIKLFFPNLQKNWIPFLKWKEFSTTKARLNELLYQMIQLRRDRAQGEVQKGYPDLLSMLIDAKDENDNALSDSDLHSELMTLLFAGHETIATALAWTVYRTYQTPEYLARVRTEDQDNAIHDRHHVSFLDALISETLRIYPIGLILFPRIVKRPMTLGEYDLPKGTVTTGSIYLTHQRPELYPNPREFRPERFLEHKFKAYEYYPFGGGNRRCLGSAFAPFMIKLIVSQIAQTWDLEILDQHPLRPVRRGVTTAPQGGIKLQVKARSASSSSTDPNYIPQSA